MAETGKKDFQQFVAEAGQVERILASMEFSKPWSAPMTWKRS